jgi:hypothetical protein
MGYRPPKGVRPPQLEGKRTGRPRASQRLDKVWEDALWGYRHRFVHRPAAPSAGAALWWHFGYFHPEALEEFLTAYGKL